MNIETKELTDFAINKCVSISESKTERFLVNAIVELNGQFIVNETLFFSHGLNAEEFYYTLSLKPYSLSSLNRSTLIALNQYGLLGHIVFNQAFNDKADLSVILDVVTSRDFAKKSIERIFKGVNVVQKQRIFEFIVENYKTCEQGFKSEILQDLIDGLFIEKALKITPKVVEALNFFNINLKGVMRSLVDSKCSRFESGFSFCFNFNALASSGFDEQLLSLSDSLNETIQLMCADLDFVGLNAPIAKLLGIEASKDFFDWLHQLDCTCPVFTLTALKACISNNMLVEVSMRNWGEAFTYLVENQSKYIASYTKELSRGVLAPSNPLTIDTLVDIAFASGNHSLLQDCLMFEKSLFFVAENGKPSSSLAPFSNLDIAEFADSAAAKSAIDMYVQEYSHKHQYLQTPALCYRIKDKQLVPHKDLFSITKDGYEKLLSSLHETMSDAPTVGFEFDHGCVPHQLSYIMDVVGFDRAGNIVKVGLDSLDDEPTFLNQVSLVVNLSYTETIKAALRKGYHDIVLMESRFVRRSYKLLVDDVLKCLFEEAIVAMVRERTYVAAPVQLIDSLFLIYQFDLFNEDYEIDGMGVREFIVNLPFLRVENFVSSKIGSFTGYYSQSGTLPPEKISGDIQGMCEQLKLGRGNMIGSSISSGLYNHSARLADLINYITSTGVHCAEKEFGNFSPFHNLSFAAYVMQNDIPCTLTYMDQVGDIDFGGNGDAPLRVKHDVDLWRSESKDTLSDAEIEALILNDQDETLHTNNFTFSNPFQEALSKKELEGRNLSVIDSTSLYEAVWGSIQRDVIDSDVNRLCDLMSLNHSDIIDRRVFTFNDVTYVIGDAHWSDIMKSLYAALWVKGATNAKYDSSLAGTMELIEDDLITRLVFIGSNTEGEVASNIKLSVEVDKQLLSWLFVNNYAMTF